jgi:hypothetical protein
MSRRNGLAHALRRVYFSTIAGIHPRGRTGKGLWKIGREIIWIRLLLPYLIDFIGRRLGSPYLTESLCFRNVRLHDIYACVEEAGKLGCAIRIDWRHSPQRLGERFGED